jgi:opacity protein-like surface antigen
MTNVSIGYEMGRFLPYVTAGVGLAKANNGPRGGLPNASDSLNNLFTGSSGPKVLTTIGAGVNYAVTDQLTLGVAVSTVQSHGILGPQLP